MKKISLAVVLLAGLLVSCGGKKAEAPVAVIDTEAIEVIDESNAKNSLDWAGTYKGVLPAADAEGMDVTIVLSPEYTFSKTYSYVGKKGEPVTETGSFTWSTDGNTVILVDAEAPNQYFVSEGRIIQLDTEGNTITGDIASQYVLTQVQQINE